MIGSTRGEFGFTDEERKFTRKRKYLLNLLSSCKSCKSELNQFEFLKTCVLGLRESRVYPR